MKKLVNYTAALLLSVSLLTAFTSSVGTIEFEVPSNFPAPVYDLKRNPITEKGFELGRKLFYDKILSRDNVVSCGSCHQHEAAFVQAGHDFSHGVDNKHGRRNTLPIFNALFKKTFFWDGGVHNLDLTPLNAIENPVEMDEKLENILSRLNLNSTYRKDFINVFQVDSITSKEFLQALAQFMSAMISANSRYDQFVRKEGVSLSTDELEGLKLFKIKCGTCHATDLFTDESYRNNGLTNDFRFDKGREEITLNPSDKGKFKVPSLRNVEFTAPYMHNGSLETLEEVLDHYETGMKDSPALDEQFRLENSKIGIPLTLMEKRQIILFLKTLSDEKFIRDKRFSEYR